MFMADTSPGASDTLLSSLTSPEATLGLAFAPPQPSGSAGQLGRYVLVRQLAASNDIVWEATDPQMRRRVAVKELVLPPTNAERPRRDRIERFYREARAAGAMSHPAIVTIHEVGEDDGRYFIAMEYLEGQTLRERLVALDGLPLPLGEATRIAAVLCDALGYAHEHGIIHRDIKPDNVHLLPDGRVKLADFGIARIAYEESLTVSGQLLGTPSYMSPEQVTGRSLDARSDLFSLGVVLYEMLAGKKPFRGDSIVTITYRIVNEPVPSVLGYPYTVESVLRRALAKDPRERFASAAEMREALLAAARYAGALDDLSGPLPVIPPPRARRPAAVPADPADEKTLAYQEQAAPPKAVDKTQMVPVLRESGDVSADERAGPVAATFVVPAALTPLAAPAPAQDRRSAAAANRSRALPALLTILAAMLALASALFAAWLHQAPRAASAEATQTGQADKEAREREENRAFERALGQFAVGQWEQAAAEFRRLHTDSADIETRARASLRLLYCYRRLGKDAAARGDHEGAIGWFQAAVDLAPEDSRARHELDAATEIVAP